MPPRFAYWTILIDNAPTAFRARDVQEILPTLNQLKRTNPNVVLKWFSGGRLWDSPEAARDARRRPKTVEKRGADWRPGGQHRDPRARFAKKTPKPDRDRRGPDANRDRRGPDANRDRRRPGSSVAKPFRPAPRPHGAPAAQPFRAAKGPRGAKPFRPAKGPRTPWRPFKPFRRDRPGGKPPRKDEK